MNTSNKLFWTKRSNPFSMGGKMTYCWGAMLPCTGPYKTGVEDDVHLMYKATSPEGRTVISESLSGAIVGSDLLKVTEDVTSGDPDIMKAQIALALQERVIVKLVTEKEFWDQYPK